MTADHGTSSRPSGPARRARSTAAVAALAAALLAPGGAGAQQALTSNRINFNFSNPGARSLGFGGAFAALADDATAAFANPAGLVLLTRPEVSLEGRSWDRSPSFLAGGRDSGEPTGRGIDTVSGLVVGRDESAAAGPSFAAVVVPRGRWSFAVYGHQLSRFEITTEFQGLFFADDPDSIPFPPIRSPAFREHLDLEIVAAGVAAARRINERLSVGLALVHSNVALDKTIEVFTYDLRSPDTAYEPIPFTPERRISRQDLSIDDTDLTVQAGALWRATERLSAGVFYRQGAETEGVLRSRVEFLGEVFEAEGTGTYRVPDVWGVGLAYRSPGGALTLAGELDRVGYEGLLEERLGGEEVVLTEYRDAWEYHLGAEYALLKRRPIVAFRLGGWVEPEGDLLGDDVYHLAAGLGVAAERFQVDLAVDFSEEIDTGSVSVIYGF
jgi:long-subunit fatty acid transport protein